MASEQPTSESSIQNRPRRTKPDPQVVVARSATAVDASTNQRSPLKIKSKPAPSSDSVDADADLFAPGDIVWCKLGSFPWWPALVCQCDAEGGIHTKTLNSNNKSKRQFFVYFYGKYLEYSWISTRWLLKYAGLSSFIQNAEAAVQQASTKSEQQELANRYQLKVSMKKRVQWDEAIELADRALTVTNAERIEEFRDLLEDALETKNQSKHNGRSRKASLDESQDDEQVVTHSSITNGTEKPSQKSAEPHQNGINGDEQPAGKKRGRKSKAERVETDTKKHRSKSITSPKGEKRPSRASVNKPQASSSKRPRPSEPAAMTNGSDVEYEYPSSSHALDQQQAASPAVHLVPANNPPLSNYEQKQIVEGLLHHPNGPSLSFDDAQTFAKDRAMDIVYENHHYRMSSIAPEWFYDAILLKHPSLVFKYPSWFEGVKIDVIPDGNDIIQLKQWQSALMLHAQVKVEQHTSSNEN